MTRIVRVRVTFDDDATLRHVTALGHAEYDVDNISVVIFCDDYHILVVTT